MNSIIYILFISFLLIQATKIVTAKPLHVNLSPPVTTNENEKLTQKGPHKALLEEKEKRIPPPGRFVPSGATFEESEEREKRIPWPPIVGFAPSGESQEREKRIPWPHLGRFVPSGESEEREKRIPWPPLGGFAPSGESEEREKRHPPNDKFSPSGTTFKENEEREKRRPPLGKFVPSGTTFEENEES